MKPVLLFSSHKPARILVIITKTSKDGYQCRLPQVTEVSNTILSAYTVKSLDKTTLLVNTGDTEVAPWDLFDPFPPKNYFDYGYLDLKSKQGSTIINELENNQTFTFHFWRNLLQKEKHAVLTAEGYFPVYKKTPPIFQNPEEWPDL
jgi:hypothetical protein